jgi:hypothetical protein
VSTFTTRELRSIAAILDGLNKARGHNSRMGVPTTPDVFTARFPTGLVAVLRWTEGVHSDDPKRQRAIEQRARHRAGYVLDLDTEADLAAAIPLQDPQPVKRGNRVHVDLRGGAHVTDIARQAVRDNPNGLK